MTPPKCPLLPGRVVLKGKVAWGILPTVRQTVMITVYLRSYEQSVYLVAQSMR